MKKILIFISLISLNIFCAEVRRKPAYFKVIGGYENLINKFVKVYEEVQDLNGYNGLIEEYFRQKPPRQGKIFRGYSGPNVKTDDEYLFHENWLEDMGQEAKIFFNIQDRQLRLDEDDFNLYVKICKGALKDKIVRVKPEVEGHIKPYSKRFVGCAEDLVFLSENDFEAIDQEIGKQEFEKQLKVYFQKNK